MPEDHEQRKYTFHHSASLEKKDGLLISEIAEVAVKFTKEENFDRPVGLQEKLSLRFASRDEFEKCWAFFRQFMKAKIYHNLQIVPFVGQKGHPAAWLETFPKYSLASDYEIKMGPKVLERIESGDLFRG